MAAPIRPPVWPTAPIAPGRADARMTAQKAFFQAALTGKAIEPAAPVKGAAASQPGRTSEPAAESDRILPPGSIIDIRV